VANVRLAEFELALQDGFPDYTHSLTTLGCRPTGIHRFDDRRSTL
jgi:hypothetical protein